MDEELQRDLQDAGIYHVIAISGGNIAILAGLIVGAFRWAGWLGRSAMLTAIVALVSYGYLVGGGASVNRATFAAVLAFSARAMDHRCAPLNTLACVAACLVVAAPLSVTDPAFSLTFGATFAILTWARPTAAFVRPRVRTSLLNLVAPPLAGLFVASLAAEAMLLPLGATFFSRVTFAGLALNFLAIPLMAIAQIAGLAVVPMAVVSPTVALLVGYVAHCGAAGLVWSAHLLRFMPSVAHRVAPPHWLAVLTYYAALVVGWTLWSHLPFRRAAVSVALASGFWIVAQPWAWLGAQGDGSLHVTFLDVGQGDAAFVRFPRGATLLVDAGGLSAALAFDIGDRVVAPVLRAAGVRRLGVFALSHGDPDHIGGAPSVLAEFDPREIWEGIAVPHFAPLDALKERARVRRAVWSTVTRGDRFTVDGVAIEILHPEPADWERRRVRNDDSIVLDLRWRDVSVLLTGDIGRDVEQRLISTIAPAPIRLVKVAHHGSLTSSTAAFVRAIRPRVAVVSVGRANQFGHPAPEVLRRYSEAGAALFRTDRDGAVTLETDGRSLLVLGYTGRTLSTR